MRSPLPVRGLALACLLAAASDASASGLQIAPTSIEMAAAGPAQALWLTNTGDHELRAQVRAYKWSQAGGKDVLDGWRFARVNLTECVKGGPRRISLVLRTCRA